jgi:hypothetical protein
LTTLLAVTVGSPLTTKFFLRILWRIMHGGNVVRWPILDAKPAYKYKLRVLRPHGAGEYEGAGTSMAEFPTGSGISNLFHKDVDPSGRSDRHRPRKRPPATIGLSEPGIGKTELWLPPLPMVPRPKPQLRSHPRLPSMPTCRTRSHGHDHANPSGGQPIAWDSPRTEQLMTDACMDCHSNLTHWPWYSNIAPISWLVQKDVEDGREFAPETPAW